MRVARGTDSSSAASAGARVRMSCTTTSGRACATAGRVWATAATTASYGCSGRSRVGNTGNSGAATKRIPWACTASRQRDHVSKVTS